MRPVPASSVRPQLSTQTAKEDRRMVHTAWRTPDPSAASLAFRASGWPRRRRCVRQLGDAPMSKLTRPSSVAALTTVMRRVLEA